MLCWSWQKSLLRANLIIHGEWRLSHFWWHTDPHQSRGDVPSCPLVVFESDAPPSSERRDTQTTNFATICTFLRPPRLIFAVWSAVRIPSSQSMHYVHIFVSRPPAALRWRRSPPAVKTLALCVCLARLLLSLRRHRNCLIQIVRPFGFRLLMAAVFRKKIKAGARSGPSVKLRRLIYCVSIRSGLSARGWIIKDLKPPQAGVPSRIHFIIA